MSGVEKGPNNLDDTLAREVREAKEARVKEYTSDQLRALQMSGIDPGEKPKTAREIRQEKRQERREARREKWAARGWKRGERVSDDENRYTEDETVPNKTEQQIMEDVQRYAGKTFDRIAIGDGIDVPGEGTVIDGKMGSAERDLAELEGKAMAGNREYNSEGLTWINEGNGEIFSQEDIARERAEAMRQAREKGQTFTEEKFLKQLQAKLEKEGYTSGNVSASLEKRIAQRGKKGRVGKGEDASESGAAERKAAEADVARRRAAQEKWAQAAPDADKSAEAPTDGLE